MDRPDEPTLPDAVCPDCGTPLFVGSVCPACSETVAHPRVVGPGDDDEMQVADPAAPASGDGPFTGPRRIAGYRILRELGAGGMGAVYEAYEEKMQRRVALKVMSRHHAPSAKNTQRFELEAWIAGKLDHPNLVKVYECGDWEELHYYSMELLDGGSLYDVACNMRQWGRDDRWNLTFGTREYVHWVLTQVIATARGLDYAHRQGVVHRDVKPMNLLLSRELKTVKIADFGLAIDVEGPRLTTVGKVLGTLTYMAPEQILGKRDQIDLRTDVYALGVTLFELLTLELPYSGKTQQLYVNAVLTSDARRAGKLNNLVSRDLEVVILKALEKRPRDRYASAAAFADDLENVLNLRPIAARPSGSLTRAGKWIRRKPIHAALLATLIVAVPSFAFFAAREVQVRRAALGAQVDDLLQQARFLEDRKRHAERVERAGEILRLDPDNLHGLRHRALSRALLAGKAPAGADRERLAEAAQRDATRLTELLPDRAWPHAVRGFVLRSLGDEEGERREAALADRYRTGDPSTDEIDLDARLAMAANDYARALELFGRLAILQPDNAPAVASRGAAYDFLGEFDSAASEYRLALGFNPELYEPHVDMARILIRDGELDQAAQYLQRAIELESERWRAHSVMADVLVRQGDAALATGQADEARRLYREAESAAMRAIAISSDQPEAHVNLGMALMQRSRSLETPDLELIARARQAYDRVLTSWQEPPADGEPQRVYLAALNNSCDALIELRELNRATRVCSRVADLQPDDPLPFYNLAGIHAMRGDFGRAVEFLRLDLEKGDTDWRWLESDAWFEPLRDDPRFREILTEMKRAAGDGEPRG